MKGGGIQEKGKQQTQGYMRKNEVKKGAKI